MVSAITGGATPPRKTLADQTDVVKVLYYGEQGTGKTLDLATLGRLGPVIFVNAVGNDIRGYVDIVVATKVAVDGQYVGITKPRFGLMGKDRFGALPTTMVNPTMERIIAVINDELDPEEVAWRPSE
jgi:hypothetical protein